MAHGHTHERRSLVCPAGLGEPAELLTFTQGSVYTEEFIRLELTDDEQRAIETGIMLDPTLPAVLNGTGAVREFQCSTPSESKGSLHLSVFYVYLPEVEQVYLIGVFLTEDVGTITAEERAELKAAHERIAEHGAEAWV